MTITAVVLAAGQGTRMRSAVPKVLHDLCGRPLVAWPVDAARRAGAERIVVVVSPGADLGSALPEGVQTAVQPQADGTGGAVRAAAPHLPQSGTVLVVNGDVPLVDGPALAALLEAHATAKAAVTIGSATLADPGTYGRIVRAADGGVARIVEAKAPGDAAPEELAIREVNAGVYAFDATALHDALAGLRTDNAQGELYLTDAVALVRDAGGTVAAHDLGPEAMLGINDRVQLAEVRAIAQRRILEAHMLAGVTIVDPQTTWIDAGVTVGRDTRLEPGTQLKGETAVGHDAVVGPQATVLDSVVGDGCTVRHSYLDRADVAAGASVGPFAYLRPGARLGEGAKVGTFVEVKNSSIGDGTKIPHLSYIGDADVGPGSNLGAATITANYDGRAKHRTTIGADVRGGVDVSFVAPVTVGDRAVIAAGSVITQDVPPGALGVARERQRNVEGYRDRSDETA